MGALIASTVNKRCSRLGPWEGKVLLGRGRGKKSSGGGRARFIGSEALERGTKSDRKTDVLLLFQTVQYGRGNWVRTG